MAFIKKRLMGLGIVMAAAWALSKLLYPAGSDPFHAEASALALRGQRLFSHMRASIGKDALLMSADCDDSGAFLEKVLASANDSRHLVADNVGCLWNVFMGGLTSTNKDGLVLVSANLNPIAVSRARNDGLIPIGVTSGASRSLLGDRAIIVVRRDGSAQIIKAQSLTRATLLRSATNETGRIDVLTPWNRLVLDLL